MGQALKKRTRQRHLERAATRGFTNIGDALCGARGPEINLRSVALLSEVTCKRCLAVYLATPETLKNPA